MRLKVKFDAKSLHTTLRSILKNFIGIFKLSSYMIWSQSLERSYYITFELDIKKKQNKTSFKEGEFKSLDK